MRRLESAHQIEARLCRQTGDLHHSELQPYLRRREQIDRLGGPDARTEVTPSATSALRSCLGTGMGAFSAVLLFCHQPVMGVPQLAGWIEAEYR